MTTKEERNVQERYGDLLFILNKRNKLIEKDIIDDIFKTRGINFSINDITRYIIALTHKSYCISSTELTMIVSRMRNDKMLMKYESDTDKMNCVTELLNSDRDENNIMIMENSYERLEYLGDSIIHAIITEYIYQRYPDEHEGYMTKLRTKLENSDTLARFAHVIGLDEYILMSNEFEEMNGRYDNTPIREDVFEAFIGALYLDVFPIGKNVNSCISDTHIRKKTTENKIDTKSKMRKRGESKDVVIDKKYKQNNYDVCKELLWILIQNEIDFSALNSTETNFKDLLLQYAHKKRLPDPVYGSKNIIGYSYHMNDKNQMERYHTSHEYGNIQDIKQFRMFVKINGEIVGIGQGNSKKKGEQEAARMALKKFGEIHDDSDESEEEYVYSMNEMNSKSIINDKK